MYKMRKEKGFKTFLVMIHKPATLSLRTTVHEVTFQGALFRWLSLIKKILIDFIKKICYNIYIR